jgi:hypothetical protein
MISNLVNEGGMMPLMQTLSTSPKNSLESRNLHSHNSEKSKTRLNTSSTSHGKTWKDKTENKRIKKQKPKKSNKNTQPCFWLATDNTWR